MSNIRYSVEHKDHSTSFVSHFSYLMQMKILVDTTLVCSNTNMIKVHKIVLAATSSYFEDILTQKPGDLLFILKMSFDVLKNIVEFMYTGKTSFLEIHKEELLSAARFLKIRGLMELNFADTLPEFQAPIIINQPVNIKQESYQVPADNNLPDSVFFCSTINDNTSIDVENIIYIPIEIEESEHNIKTLSKRNRSRHNTHVLGQCDNSASTNTKSNRSTNQQLFLSTDQLCTKLLKSVRCTIHNIEQHSIKTIRKLKELQEKNITIDQMELSQAINYMVTMEKQTGQRCDIPSSVIDNVFTVEPMRSFGDENRSWMINSNQNYIIDDQNCNKENLMPNQNENNFKTVSGWLKYQQKMSDKGSTGQSKIPNEAQVIPYTEFNNTEKTGEVKLYHPFYNKNESQWMMQEDQCMLSHCENVLRSAGLPTDVPFLFKSQDGSYINLTGETLLDMVQSSNMEFEVIERKDLVTENA